MKLRVHGGAFEVEAFGQTLLSENPSWAVPLTNSSGRITVLESASSNTWEYLRIDLSHAAGPSYDRWHRHLLFVAPNLFAILDEIALTNPGHPGMQICSPGSLMLEARSGDFRVEAADAGLTAHIFDVGARSPASWQCNRLSDRVTFTTAATNQVEHLRRLTLVIPHAAGRKGGTGFKLLESESAIGARIWRDGLPTLIAFRTTPPGTESSLTSMPVVGPVAVDAFDPNAVKRRKGAREPKRVGP